MNRIIFIFLLTICCEPIWGQTDSLYERSISAFRNLDVNVQIRKDTLKNEQKYYIRQSYSNNEDFSRILHSIAEMKPYTLIYKVIFKEINGKNIISFVQCESCDDVISEFLKKPEVSISVTLTM